MSTTVKSISIMLLGFSATVSYADVILKYSSQTSGKPNTVMVSGTMVRTESTNPRGKNMSIYDNSTKILTLIDERKKSYVIMDNATVEKQAKRIQELRKKALREMQQQLQQMSPEQRKLMGQKMEDMGVSGNELKQAPSRFSTNRAHRSEIVNGIRCEVYESFRNQEKIGEACIADPQTIKISNSDYETLQGLFAFLRSMTKRFISDSPGAGAEMSMFDNVEGLPIKMANTEGDTMILEHVGSQALPPELFVVPSGYELANMSGADTTSDSGPDSSTNRVESNPAVNRPGADNAYGTDPQGYRWPYDQRGYGGTYTAPASPTNGRH